MFGNIGYQTLYEKNNVSEKFYDRFVEAANNSRRTRFTALGYSLDSINVDDVIKRDSLAIHIVSQRNSVRLIYSRRILAVPVTTVNEIMNEMACPYKYNHKSTWQ